MERCKDPECCVSTGICGSITAGKDDPDEWGYFDKPCHQCAEYFKELENPKYSEGTEE